MDLSARARNIATAARSLPEALRREFVAKACDHDGPLRAEVETLLGWEPAAGPAPDEGLDRMLAAALPQEPEPAPISASAAPPSSPVPAARRKPPWLLLFATATLVWLAFVVVEQSRRLAETARQRDRAMIAETAARAALTAAQDEARTSRATSERIAQILAAEGPEFAWRDRVAIWKLLDRGTALMEADSSVTVESRARLLEAMAGAYRAHRLGNRADSLLDRARALRGSGPPPGISP